MSDSTTVPVTGAPEPRRGLAARVLRAALVVFALDGLYVVLVFVLIIRRTTVERMFQGIAYAVLGQAAFTGGEITGRLDPRTVYRRNASAIAFSASGAITR